MIFSPARRVRDNTTKHTLENAKKTNEVVINTVSHEMVQQMSLASTEYAEGVNEFEKAGFTMLESDFVKPYRVAESPVQFECRVKEVVPLGDQGGAGNLIICEVLAMHIDEEVLGEDGRIDQEKLDLVARAGGSYYTRAKEGFFEIPKPLSTLGIGVDRIPKSIRNSEILTGNDLGKLGNTEALPSEETVKKFAEDHPEFVGIDRTKKHTFAKRFLDENDIESAWKLLLMNN
jgi:flavin reductase (DIM6/NTAB) family NADH-FMN oxidoreductase RutF